MGLSERSWGGSLGHRSGPGTLLHSGAMVADSEGIREAVRTNFLFDMLTDTELDALLKALVVRRYADGQPIVNEGEPADALYLVVSGAVNVTKANGQFLAAMGENGFFGEMGLFNEGTRRTANCIASGETTCAMLDKESLESFCDGRPEIGLKVYRAIVQTLCERLQATSADLAMLMGTRVKSQAEVTNLVEKARGKT